jgi:hypothetical protein
VKTRFSSFFATHPHGKETIAHLFGVAKRASLFPLTWVVVGILMLFIGLALHTAPGTLLSLVGFLLLLASLFVWFAKAWWRDSNLQHTPPDETQETDWDQPGEQRGPAIRLRIQEESLSVLHLLDTLSAFLSLYVQMWLLQKGRFPDFVSYTKQSNRRFEKEANLLIAKLEHNSPATITFNLDLSPKTLVEAFQKLVDTIFQLNLRIEDKMLDNKMKELDIKMKEEEIKAKMLETKRKDEETYFKNRILAFNEIARSGQTINDFDTVIEYIYPEPVEDKKRVIRQILLQSVRPFVCDEEPTISFSPDGYFTDESRQYPILATSDESIFETNGEMIADEKTTHLEEQLQRDTRMTRQTLTE